MNMRPEVMIGDRSIGGCHPVYVIAEAGVNHDGDRAVAHKLIDAAHGAGADAVKFQVFSADRLVAQGASGCAYQAAHAEDGRAPREMLRRLELDAAALGELKRHADELGLGFLATPFGLTEVQLLVDLGLSAIKIASSDVVNTPLLIAAARSALPLIVSTGAADGPEVDRAVETLRTHGTAADRLILMHCVSAYPTAPQRARLGCMQTLSRRFSVPVGFSDHTSDATFSGLAVAAGAEILEKHITLDRRGAGPDHFFSLQPEQFATYVASARQARAALGDGEICTAPEEDEVRRLARGSLVTTASIKAGETVEADRLDVQRPADGIAPTRWKDVVGRVARTDIPANTRLSWSMLR